MSDEKTIGLDALDTADAAEQGAVLEVRHPGTGEVMRWPDGRPWTITYFGSDSDRLSDVARRQADRRSEQMMRTRKPALSAVVEKDNIELLVAATREWDLPLGDGNPAPNEPKEFRAAYGKYKWLYEQGNEFVGNRANFLTSKPSI